jgi:ABC-type sugar transport system substrate-binding protein
MRKSTLELLCRAAVLTLAVVACGRPLFAQSGSGAKTPYVIFVNPLVGNPVFTAEENGFKKAAAEFNFKLKIIGPSTIDDTQMVQAVESAIAERPAAIATVPYNFSALENTYKKAAALGIPIFNSSSDSPEATRVVYVGTDNTQYGIMAADYLAKKTGAKAAIAVMLVRLDISNQLQQKKAFEARIAEKYPGMKVVITEQDGGDPMAAVQKFQDIYKAHPEVNAIVCLDSVCCDAAALVTNEMKLAGKTAILAIDDNASTLDYIRKGITWATMAQNFYKMGYVSGKYIVDKLNGRPVPSYSDSGTVLITKENVDTYKDAMLK